MNSKTEFNQKAFLEKLTQEPGIYRMLDNEGTVLYVGKARNLKKRVGSYFSKQNVGNKTRSLINQIASIEVTVTRSETEALLLESNLIKALTPRYNVLLRDDKTYPYIQLSGHPDFPRIEMFRSKKKPKKGLIFGPYPSVAAVRETLSIIQKVFKIRNCRDSYFNARSRPCLQFQIQRCSAPCTAGITKEDYQRSLHDAIRFLQGKCNLILEELTMRMEQAVKNLAFEEAANLRDQIRSLRLVQEQQSIVQLRGDADVIVMEVQPGFACVQCTTIREGQVIASKSYFPTVPKFNFSGGEPLLDELAEEVFAAFVSYYYVDSPERIPDVLVIKQELRDLMAWEKMLSQLRGKEVKIHLKPRGVKGRWLDFALKNLQLAINEHHVAAATMDRRYQALVDFLHLQTPILRMECFDISHTQGQETIASCVVFDKHGPANKAYRRYNIRDITPGDDYAAIEQALRRRLHTLLANNDLPSILIIDGGKGQVHRAKEVLKELGITTELILLGIAKGVDRKAGWERLIIADEDRETVLPMDSPALHLLQHIRDEAHRFAITAHRKKRQQAGLQSSLQTIEGVGPKRRQALMNRFGGIRDLAKAPLEEISKVPGISAELAARIFAHFHS